MKGVMIIFQPTRGDDGPPEEVIELTAPPPLEDLQQRIGGYIQPVPHLKTIEVCGGVYQCVAFCNEEGKFKQMPFNRRATELWRLAIERETEHEVHMRDILVGPLVVIVGDDELLGNL